MATLNEAPEQLRNWINELDGRIGMLTEQRDMLASALAALDGSAFDPEPPRPDALVDLADIEARRKADRERKKAERQRNKTATPAARQANRPGGSKYDYDEVARVANAAIRGNVSMVEAVASRYGVSSAMGSYLIKVARKCGHDIAKVGHGVKAAPVAPTSNVTPLLPAADIETATHPATGRPPGSTAGARAFTPDDTLKLLQGG